MSHIIMRTEKLKSSGNVGGSAAHIERTRQTPNADSDRTHLNRWLIGGPGMHARAKEVWESLDKKPRKGSVHGFEVVLTASPEAWPSGWQEGNGKEFIDEFARRGKAWLEKEFAKRGATIVGAQLQLDESTPHIQAIVIPTHRDKQNRRGLSAFEYLGSRQKLSTLQDSAAHAFATMGLERGVKGSKARHTRISEYYSAMQAPVAKGKMPPAHEYQVKTGAFSSEPLKLIKPDEAKETIKGFAGPLRDQARAGAVASKKAKQLSKSNGALSEALENERRERRALADRLRAIDLRDVLQAYGCTQDRQDKAKWHTPAGTISVTEGRKFYDFSAEKGGGGAIDLVMHIEETDYNGALASLSRTFGDGPTVATAAARAAEAASQAISERSATPDPFRPPEHREVTWERVRRYLVKGRQLLGRLVDQMRELGQLGSDKRGNAFFLLRDLSGSVVGADLRGTGASHFRGNAPGSQANSGLFIVGTGTKQLIVSEGAIDAMSLAELYPDATVISTGGSRKLDAAREYLQAHGQDYPNRVCASDADAAGAEMAKNLDLPHFKPPSKSNDWNEHLQLVKSSSGRSGQQPSPDTSPFPSSMN